MRYKGHPDTWKIGIYLHSTQTYTEAELPDSFGPVTGTPEEGANHTFPLYHGPGRQNRQHNTTESNHHSE